MCIGSNFSSFCPEDDEISTPKNESRFDDWPRISGTQPAAVVLTVDDIHPFIHPSPSPSHSSVVTFEPASPWMLEKMIP